MERLRSSDMNKPLVLLGHLSLIITAILSCIFYKERVMYTDPGQQLFEMINHENFMVYVKRYSMVINQSIPLLAIKLGLPLKVIAISYSLSFIIIFYLCFLICTYGFKNIGAGLGIAFAPIIIRAAFGHSISEAWLGVAYSAVFYAILNYYDQWKSKGMFFILLFYFSIGLVTAINYYIHPITLFTLAFSIGFTYFNKKQYNRIYIYVVSIFVITPYLYNFLFPSHVHDQSFFEGLKKAPLLLPKVGSLPIWKFILSQFGSLYFIPAILILWIAVISWKNKKIVAFVFLLTFIIIYIIIACLAFYKGEPRYGMESRLMPLAFMIIIPLIEIIRNKKRNYFQIIAITTVLLVSYVNLFQEVRSYHSSRIRFYEDLLTRTEKYTEKKFYIYYTREQDLPVNSWGSAVETLLLSSLNGSDNSKSLVFVSADAPVDKGLTYWNCVFIWVPWYPFLPEEKLNKKYYDLKCSSYKELPHSFIEQ